MLGGNEMKVAIVGATGYGGLELIRLLKHHPEAEIVSLHRTSDDRQEIASLYPHLVGTNLPPLESIDPEKISKTAEVVFLATPSGTSKVLAPLFVDFGLKVIDLSGDFRLKKGTDYKKWYHQEPAADSYLQQAEYGLAEFRIDEKASFISNPGCYATATLLGLAPLLQQQMIETSSIIIDAKSGISGSGKTPTALTHFTEINDNVIYYKVGTHQHIPEIMQKIKEWDPEVPGIQFATSLIPITRGLMATIYMKPKQKTSAKKIQALYQHVYEKRRFVRIMPAGELPTIKQVVGSNYCDIGINYHVETNTLAIVSVIDNLIKGAAGQAIQNFNSMNGFEETEGLDFVPVYP